MMDFQEFKNPGPINRPAPFWSWNDKLDRDELKRQLHEMIDKGWGSYFMHSRVGLVTEYLSDEWLDLIKELTEEAGNNGSFVWLYDEDKWPSGFAGGIVPQDEANRSRGLVFIESSKITEYDTVIKNVNVDGKEYSICNRISAMGNPSFNGACYVDLMNRDTVKAFFDSTHEKYKQHCGQSFGNVIKGMFTDEACYMMIRNYKEPVVPWSNRLPDYFRSLKGYSIEDKVDELFLDINDYQKTRFDFFDAATRLFLDSFTKQYYDWCSSDNLVFTGHFMGEDNLKGQADWIGAAMPHYEYMHWPGVDKLEKHLKQVITMKQLTSVVDQLGKERALCETFGGMGQQVSFFYRKWVVDWQAALGISFVNHHLSLYSIRGERKRDYPPNLFYQQPWWDNEKKFSDYIGRLSYAVTQGKRCVDILIIHPISSIWCEYSPFERWETRPSKIEFYNNTFMQLSESLMYNKLDYHYGDEMIMEKHAKINNGKLVIGQHSYSTVIVPPCITLRSNTYKLLKEFASIEGNRLIIMKPIPDRIDGVLTQIEWPESVVITTSLKETVSSVSKLYPDRISISDPVNGASTAKIICHERIDENGRYIFCANTDETRAINTVIKMSGEWEPYVLDLTTGEIYSVDSQKDNGFTKINVKFYPAGSILLYIPKSGIKCAKAPAFMDSGVEFGFPRKSIMRNNVDTVRECKIRFNEDNVLPINEVTLFMDGKMVLEKQPLSRAWHKHFYKAPDGTLFKAVYSFEAVNAQGIDAFAVIEMAENLDRIIFNGVEVEPLKKRGEMGAFNPEKSWKDLNFTKVPLKGLIKDGINELVIEGKKVNNVTGSGTHIGVKDYKNHIPTEIETVYIVGNFTVEDEDLVHFWIDGAAAKPDHRNIAASGYPFYAGSVDFIFELDIKRNADYIKLNKVNAACVQIFVNGKPAGLKYWEPYVFDVRGFLRQGKNEVLVRASNTLFNLLGPNNYNNIENNELVGPFTFINTSNYNEKYAILPFGLESICVF